MRSLFAFLLFVFVPLLLFWIPIPGAGSVIGGLVGGYVAGSAGRAVLLALLPAILLALLTILLLGGFGLPLIGGLVASVGFVIFAIHSVALLIGAIIGGLVAQNREPAVPTTA
jgi:hypothetical protein